MVSSPIVSSLTMQTAQQGNQLSFVKSEIGEAQQLAIVSRLIGEVSHFFNANFSEQGCVDMAEMICRDYWYMKMEEIMFVVKQGIMGKYGKVYGNLSLGLIAEWISIYEQHRSGNFDTSHEINKGQMNGTGTIRYSESNSLKDIVSKLQNEKRD